jgi:hypothetical protein
MNCERGKLARVAVVGSGKRRAMTGVMTKTAAKQMLRTLPKLRTSVLWFKRDLAKRVRRMAEDARNPKMAAHYYERASKIRKMDLAEIVPHYLDERVCEIKRDYLCELAVALHCDGAIFAKFRVVDEDRYDQTGYASKLHIQLFGAES